jgi:FkbM family methyltransferase
VQRPHHSGIDVLKMDIEGAEYAVIDNLREQGFLP